MVGFLAVSPWAPRIARNPTVASPQSMKCNFIWNKKKNNENKNNTRHHLSPLSCPPCDFYGFSGVKKKLKIKSWRISKNVVFIRFKSFPSLDGFSIISYYDENNKNRFCKTEKKNSTSNQ